MRNYGSMALWILCLAALSLVNAAKPTITTSGNATVLSNGDSFVMTVQASGYVKSMTLNGVELVGTAVGGYSDTGGKVVFNFTQGATIVQQTDTLLHVAFKSYLADVHYILLSGLNGHYQYVLNNALGNQGEVRSLYRLDPTKFTWGRTNIKNALLPDIADIKAGYKVQDETWQRRNGSYITKYDFSCFVRGLDFHGLHGDGYGAWIIAPGKDYYIGDHLKQELMVHRESKTNDATMLHYYHGELRYAYQHTTS